MKHIQIALRFFLLMTILLGLAYPLLVTVLAQTVLPVQAQGEFLMKEGRAVGAKLIAQDFRKPEYFWGRPSVVGHNPLPSGGSNLSLAAEALKTTVAERIEKLTLAHPEMIMRPPQELLFASASGLDPHLGPEALRYQMQRVARARQVPVEQLDKLISEMTESRTFGILGEPVVNVLLLNMVLDELTVRRY